MQTQFLNELKMARENAVLGNYTLSVQKYRKVVQMIQQHLATQHSDPGIRQKWKLVVDQVTKEMTIATETEQLKAQFAMTPGSGGQA